MDGRRTMFPGLATYFQFLIAIASGFMNIMFYYVYDMKDVKDFTSPLFIVHTTISFNGGFFAI